MNKKPVALLLNDIHVSKDNISEFQLNWDEALNICQSNNIQDIVIGGDLWQSRSSQTLSTLMAVRQAIIKTTSLGISITIAEGNHDKVDQESMLGYGHLFSEYPDVFVVDDYMTWDISEDVKLFIMSYFPEDGSFTNILNNAIEHLSPSPTKNILYIHQGINGALSSPGDKELPTHIFEDFDKVLVGHYHNRCVIKDSNIEYIGSSRQHNYGEDDMKGYTILYSDGSYSFVANKVNIKYITYNIPISDINDTLYQTLKTHRSTNRDKVRLRIYCKTSEISSVNKQHLIECGANKVEFITEDSEVLELAKHSLDKKFDKTGIKNEYYNFCADKGISDIELGLKYLDKINTICGN